MFKLFARQKFFVRPELFVYIAFFVFSGVFLVLNAHVGSKDEGILEHYLNLNGGSFVWTGVLFVMALFFHGIILWLKAILSNVKPGAVFSLTNLKLQALKIPGALRNILGIGVPFTLAFYSMSLALGPLNVFNSTRLRDELLFRWDVLLTGTFPPLSLASFQYPAWFIGAVDFSFGHLVSVLTLLGAYLLLTRPQLFREAAGAFFLSLIIMFAGWLAFPVMSPHDRFIDNVYDLPVAPDVASYVAAYQPQEGVRQFLEGMRESKQGLVVMPTSTFPSAHVVWAVLLVYYAWRIQKWLLVFILPFAVLSSIGTFFFAQHYFVDLPAGIVVAMLSIFAIGFLTNKQHEIVPAVKS